MGNIVEDDDSGCEAMRKRVPQKGKLFTSRLENAWRSKHVFKIRTIESVNAEHCKFEVDSGNSACTFYQVCICTQPYCSCPDFKTYGMRSLCKHILFVLLLALEVADINILDKTEFQTHKVLNFLKKSNIDPAFKALKAIGTAAKKKSAAINAHSDNNAPKTFEHVVKINRSISCGGLNPKTPIMIGDWCVKVDGALSVPFGIEYAVKKLFFCPKRVCITRPPVWSNILITHPLAIIKGDNIPDEDHERLMEDMENSFFKK